MKNLISLLLATFFIQQCVAVQPPRITSAAMAIQLLSSSAPDGASLPVPYKRKRRNNKSLTQNTLSFAKYSVPPAAALLADYYMRTVKQTRGLSDDTMSTIVRVSIIGSVVLIIAFVCKQVKSFFASGEDVILEEAKEDIGKAAHELTIIEQRIKLLEKSNEALNKDLTRIVELFTNHIIPALDRLNESDARLLSNAGLTVYGNKADQEDTGAGVGGTKTLRDAQPIALPGSAAQSPSNVNQPRSTLPHQQQEEYLNQKMRYFASNSLVKQLLGLRKHTTPASQVLPQEQKDSQQAAAAAQPAGHQSLFHLFRSKKLPAADTAAVADQRQ